jgi:3-phosphoshikimate 1-carboxyvinyltransferase
VSRGGVSVDDTSPINTSFPTFMGLLDEAAA